MSSNISLVPPKKTVKKLLDGKKNYDPKQHSVINAFLKILNKEFEKLMFKSYPKQKKLDRDQLSRVMLKQK